MGERPRIRVHRDPPGIREKVEEEAHCRECEWKFFGDEPTPTDWARGHCQQTGHRLYVVRHAVYAVEPTRP